MTEQWTNAPLVPEAVLTHSPAKPAASLSLGHIS